MGERRVRLSKEEAEKRDEKILELHTKGYSNSVIARSFGFRLASMSTMLKRIKEKE